MHGEEPTPDEVVAIDTLITSVLTTYPSEPCRALLRGIQQQQPYLSQVDGANRLRLSRWVCELHNAVNTELGAEVLTCTIEILDRMYRPHHVQPRAVHSTAAQTAPRTQSPQPQQDLHQQQKAISFPGLAAKDGNANDKHACRLQVGEWIQGSDVQVRIGSQLVAIIFWTPHCPTCDEAMPLLERSHRNLKSKGLTIVGVAGYGNDGSGSSVREYASRQEITFPLALSPLNDEGFAYHDHIGAYKGVPFAVVLRGCERVWYGMGFQITKKMPQILEDLVLGRD